MLSASASAADAAADEKSKDRDAVCTKCHDEERQQADSDHLPDAARQQGRRAHARLPDLPRRQRQAPERPGAARPRPKSCSRKSKACRRPRAQKRVVPHLPQDRHCAPTGPAASTRAAAWRAPTATRCTHAGDQVLTKATQADVCFACHKTQRAQTHRISHASDRRRQDGLLGLPQPARLRPGRSCSSRTRSTRPATRATPRSAARSSGSTRRSSTTARTATRRTARPTPPLLKARAPWLCQECHSGDHGNADQQRRQSRRRAT